MSILVIDNYDSFTYNLVYILKQINIEYEVYRNDKINPEEALNYEGILISPGPGIPEEAGNMPAIIMHCAGKIPILGICLGHQAIAQYLGATLINQAKVFHGIQSNIKLAQKSSAIFKGIPREFKAGRYHSWEVNPENLPNELEITAFDDQLRIMAIQHTKLNLYGVQFHPESIMSPEGAIIIQNFIKICKKFQA